MWEWIPKQLQNYLDSSDLRPGLIYLNLNLYQIFSNRATIINIAPKIWTRSYASSSKNMLIVNVKKTSTYLNGATKCGL